MNPSFQIKSRLAPTPSGFLHPGNGLSFLMTWAKVRAKDGQLLLRIDDMDKDRRRAEYIDDIFESIDWLGIDYDEGPNDSEDFLEHWSQHQRLDRYFDYLDQLRQKNMLFACDCSRKQRLQDSNADGRYSGRCINRGLSFDQTNVTWRVRLPESDVELRMNLEAGATKHFNATALDHFIVRQKNGFPAYQLTSLVDDEYFKVNFIVRGEDLLPSSWSQLYLAYLLEMNQFSQSIFWHHSLLLDDKGLKLSKSKGAGSLKAWRDRGEGPTKLLQLAAKHLEIERTEKIEFVQDLITVL